MELYRDCRIVMMTNTAKQNESHMPDEFQRPVSPVVVLDVNMISAIGIDLDQTAASVRASISRFEDSSFYSSNLSAIKMALVPEDVLPELDIELLDKYSLTQRQKRMLRLATNPLISVFDKLSANHPIPLFLAGPEKLPGRRSVIRDDFLNYLSLQTKQQIDLDNSYIFPYGRAAGLYALEAAMQYLESNPGKQVVVGGVDTHVDPHLLSTLARDGRVATEGAMDYFVPGEGAAFMVIGDEAQVKKSKSGYLLYPPGIASEPGHRYSQHPYKGDGLSKAMSDALQGGQPSKMSTVFISYNGENYFSKEWGVAVIRNSGSFVDEPVMVHPADCFGDVGAAFAPMAIGIAISGIHKNALKSPALISCSSELQYRAVVKLTTAQQEI